jgi:chromate reductase, NAD(P)H dehydrogenase (quinone)
MEGMISSIAYHIEVEPLTVLGISGSLRRASLNRALLRAAVSLAPAGLTIEITDLHGIPSYNFDDEAALPDSVAELKRRIRAADAVLIATPEYNYSIPGVLKNAVDWAARPLGDSAWESKPVAVMGASISSQGTSRAQYHLRQTLTALNCYTLNRPEALIGQADRKFDAAGNLSDEKTRELISELLVALACWIRKLN